MKFVSAFLGLIFLVNIAQAQVSSQDQILVQEEVIKIYSQGQGDDRFDMTPDDIWGYKYLNETSASCPVLVTAYANKPSYHGSALYQVYVCIKNLPNGSKFAELVDDVQIGD
ncbi:hypothetical protein AZI86_11395 [Bdellovibrio bacteriovorus]|uniref:Uncharacterized protein n=1 Tax=Bdellovibrio bacteriovorus TaxID=959 RepID=A0A150WLN6_BDEBC|nr:hypothetical protein [Bdellovibrio bacteriovorus]KYG64802.1 hypothetical protein AZI86_11395 [Bdellovibrio bacteriovorus]